MPGVKRITIKEFKKTVMIKRSYQYCIAVYQMVKLRMLEFYFNFLDHGKYFSSAIYGVL